MNSCLRTPVCKGFTLIELMITISILGILLGVGLPSFVTFINNNKITSEANDLIYSFHMARSEAIKRGTEVRIASMNGTSWADGWKVVADLNGDTDYIDAGDIIMQWDPLDGGSALTVVATNATSSVYVSFNARGGMIPNNASFIFTLTPSDCDTVASRIISITPTGRANIDHGDCS